MSALIKPRPFFEATPDAAAFAADVVRGLTATPKRLPAKYFYDHQGSKLFGEITQQPEYYPTRCELEILRAHAGDIRDLIPDHAALIEFGSGGSSKARILLDAVPQIATYVPVDVSGEYLAQDVRRLRRDYPKLGIEPVVADFTKPFSLPGVTESQPRVGFFPGSTIGNFEPHEAASFLHHAASLLGKGAMLIIGVDLVKDVSVLNAAYNDKAGVTEAFNLNLLTRMNRELGGQFNPATFEHHAFYNQERKRIEMHLASHQRQKVKVAGITVEFRAGETVHTENSYKYSKESFLALARGANWSSRAMWTDQGGNFSVHVLMHK